MDLDTAILAHELTIRLASFAGVFTAIAIGELIAPRRALTVSRTLRWTSNLALVAMNALMLRLMLPIAAVGVAEVGSAKGWGLLNILEVPFWIALPLGVIALDFVIWLQHLMFHAVPALWRLHRVHHADLDYDLTTGARFHPIEIALSMLIKCAAIMVIGPSALAVVVFEVLLSATATFNHGNLALPVALDRVLRRLVVTPDMHRVHHSVEVDEMNANFGFNLPWWDRLFGTYRDQPRAGHEAMTIGVHGLADPQEVARLGGMLLLPLRGGADSHASGTDRSLATDMKRTLEARHRDHRHPAKE